MTFKHALLALTLVACGRIEDAALTVTESPLKTVTKVEEKSIGAFAFDLTGKSVPPNAIVNPGSDSPILLQDLERRVNEQYGRSLAGRKFEIRFPTAGDTTTDRHLYLVVVFDDGTVIIICLDC